jgi:hypothetical protein
MHETSIFIPIGSVASACNQWNSFQPKFQYSLRRRKKSTSVRGLIDAATTDAEG